MNRTSIDRLYYSTKLHMSIVSVEFILLLPSEIEQVFMAETYEYPYKVGKNANGLTGLPSLRI